MSCCQYSSKLTKDADQDRSSNFWLLYGLSCTWVSCCEHSSKINKDSDQGLSSTSWLLYGLYCTVPTWRAARCPAVSVSIRLKFTKTPIRAGPQTIGFSMFFTVPELRVARCPAVGINLKSTKTPIRAGPRTLCFSMVCPVGTLNNVKLDVLLWAFILNLQRRRTGPVLELLASLCTWVTCSSMSCCEHSSKLIDADQGRSSNSRLHYGMGTVPEWREALCPTVSIHLKLTKTPIRAGPRTLGFSLVCPVPE